MASVVPNSPQLLPNPFPSTRHPHKPPHHLLSPRALDGDGDGDGGVEKTATKEADPSDPTFENRLAKVRLKYRSGSGKKAEQRKAKRSPGGAGKKKGGAVLLPPVPLREPVSSEGLAVEVGFTPYSERLNGRLAGLGLAALLLVELGSGKSLLAYHPAPMLLIQIYTVAAATALFVKFEKERISVWPEKPPSSTSSPATGE